MFLGFLRDISERKAAEAMIQRRAAEAEAGFEALARWEHPQLGAISPGEFIPITEQVNVLHEISDALLKPAAADALQWPDTVLLSFNLSPVQLCSSGTAQNVLDIIGRERLEPNRLQIEVTETALLADFQMARRNLSELCKQGVRVALDVFGAGCSSISYLRETRFDTVKLDGSLMSPLAPGSSVLPLLRGVLALCKAMKEELHRRARGDRRTGSAAATTWLPLRPRVWPITAS